MALLKYRYIGNFVWTVVICTLFIIHPILSSAQFIEAGGYHSLFLCTDATVRSCGYNDVGQLGDGTIIDRLTPVQVSSLTGITQMSGGHYHSLFLKNDSTAWACGWNNFGQLGIGSTVNKITPVQVSGLMGIVSVVGGDTHSLYLKNDGTAWACGRNNFGQLGIGSIIDKITPVQVSSLTGITAIAGDYHSLFLKNDGTAWACGNNWYGQLGNGTTVYKTLPLQVSGLCTPVPVNEITEPFAISVYPNPSTGEVFMNIDIPNISFMDVTIFNSIGEAILSQKINIRADKEIKLDLNDKPDGIYLVQVKTSDGSATKKIIINR